jgi:nudix-type nucleoside diphosphatase (YffH/AdpP family)
VRVQGYHIKMPMSVRILQRHEIFNRFIFRIDEVKLQHERFDGTMSEPITRLVLNRGDSVAVLLHDLHRQRVLLCEQFRAPTCEHGSGWLLELPAGMIEGGETADRCARREALEETGYTVQTLDTIALVYLSPGGSSERVYVFRAVISTDDSAATATGVIGEGEDIRIHIMSIKDALLKARRGEIADAKTLIALQWLELDTFGLRTPQTGLFSAAGPIDGPDGKPSGM